jgi:Holliday junction resolvase
MAKSFAQSKGARGEREIVQLLQPVVNLVYGDMGRVPPTLQRNTIQSHKGGYDLVGVDWMAIEVKRCETLSLNAWSSQCIGQAKEGQTPILFFKQNNQKWRVMMHSILVTGGASNLKVWGEIRMDDFLVYFDYRLRHELKDQNN